MWKQLLRLCVRAFPRRSVRHVSGRLPRSFEPTVLCRVRNGAEWLPSFLTHYRGLGMKRFIFLDNGSTDETPHLLRAEDTEVYRTDLDFKTHRLWMRRWLMSRCAAGTWTLNVDIDELFDYPGSGEVSLADLTRYFDVCGFTAMRATMIDCFSDEPLTISDRTTTLQERYPWFDISAMHRVSFGWDLEADLPVFRGGVRSSVFGTDHVLLSKHPLLKAGSGCSAFVNDEHSVQHALPADISGVLLHFKFTPAFPSYVAEAVLRKHHWNDSAEYVAYQAVLNADPHFSLRGPCAQRWRSVEDLIPSGIVKVSERYNACRASGIF